MIDKLRKAVETQGMDGNWNYDPYMHGLYNGMELALSILEERPHEFRAAPTAWLCDAPNLNKLLVPE